MELPTKPTNIFNGFVSMDSTPSFSSTLFYFRRSCPALFLVLTGYLSSFLPGFNLPSPSSKRSPHPPGATWKCSQQQSFPFLTNSSLLCIFSSPTSASQQGDTLLGCYLSTRPQVPSLEMSHSFTQPGDLADS